MREDSLINYSKFMVKFDEINENENCLHCNVEFKRTRNKKFCSKECQKIAYRKECSLCNKTFSNDAGLKRHIKRVHDIDKKCKICDESFIPNTSEKCCSKECQKEMKKQKHKIRMQDPVKLAGRRASVKKHKDKTRHLRNKYDDMNKQDRQCVTCQKEYIGHFQSITCSKECERHYKNKCVKEKLWKSKPFINCVQCNKPFKGHQNKQRFCSKKCQTTSKSEEQKKERILNHIAIKCKWCDNEFKGSSDKKYCSKTCVTEMDKIRLSKLQEQWRIDNPIQSKNCKNCGETFMPPTRTSVRKFCSSKCRNELWNNKPVNKLSKRIRGGVRKCLKTQGIRKDNNTFDMVDFTPEELIVHFNKLLENEPDMTLENMNEWHIDHIIPTSAFEFDSVDHPQFKACWSLGNLRPMLASENMSKNDKWIGNTEGWFD